MAEVKVTAEPNTQNIVTEVTIKAPLEKVFAAHTDPDQVVKWWSGGHPFTIESYEPVTGGKWRFLTKGLNGEGDFNFYGSFHLVAAPNRIIETFEYEGLPEPGHAALNNSVFEEVEPGVTKITTVSTFGSVTDRDGMVASGMETGFQQSMEALASVVGEV